MRAHRQLVPASPPAYFLTLSDIVPAGPSLCRRLVFLLSVRTAEICLSDSLDVTNNRGERSLSPPHNCAAPTRCELVWRRWRWSEGGALLQYLLVGTVRCSRRLSLYIALNAETCWNSSTVSGTTYVCIEFGANCFPDCRATSAG